MQDVVKVNAEKVRPENDSEDDLDEIQTQKANREEPANKPQHATEGVLFDLDFFHTFSEDILLHGVTSKETNAGFVREIVALSRGFVSAGDLPIQSRGGFADDRPAAG